MNSVYIRDIPDKMHKEIKILCAAKKMSIKDFAIELMKKEINKHEKS